MNCPFCHIHNPIVENELATTFYDSHPLNQGHLLIITKRHVSTIFDATPQERLAIFSLLDICKSLLDLAFEPNGYNIGMNCGEAAGQTVSHLHIHLIPRYAGDMESLKGGIRGLIRRDGGIYGLSNQDKQRVPMIGASFST
ncbi:diadenosine tetraphosphate (Ap4A) HIT family hydrolase [Desulfitobacterium sp. LBE]|uniref:Histidine triad domain protein n=2 Tax=root TaxID=1 RepID=A0A098B5D0_DESHA|nr:MULTISPECIES: HIT family protein [Desulfitobacterium]MEA5022924.1 HIT family protein [Desulfitobacterium hafniense]TWH57109.1 diadenosine tetraphosphate (Ap4A) HIT family hydrolase [Desulfitobacterium sp. LBE]CDX03590.1 Histidine triad domain protein [Desulfitobacterium hafniense]